MPLLNPEAQLKVLTKIWGPQRTGYVFLPWISGNAKTKDQRRDSYREGRAFKWPRDKPAILEHLKEHQRDELYFSVNLFSGKRRAEHQVLADRTLFADLDEVDPRKLDDQPTIAWESSPGRFQGIWIMASEQQGASVGGGPNHRLTSSIGADPSGWDSTQLLRVPGRPNFKHNYRPESEADSDDWEGVKGAGLLWATGPRYDWDDFEDLPEVSTPEAAKAVDEDLLASIDRHDVWGRVRLKVSSRIREMMGLKDIPVGTDRSDGAWEISRELADAGCSALEIVAVLRSTPWNKYAGRHDELKRLVLTASKAVNSKPAQQNIEEEAVKKPGVTWLADVVDQPIPRPKWLVKNIWTIGGCGFISGAPKSYKSWLGLDIAVSVATGASFLGEYAVPKPSPVLYLQEEDDLLLVMERLSYITESKVPDLYWQGQITHTTGSQFRWTPPRSSIPIAMQVQTGFTSSDEGWQAWLDEQIVNHGFKLVVIDTLGTTAGDVDTDKAQVLMERMLRPLKVLAKKHNTAIVIIHHNKKNSGEGRAGNDMLGSVALHAWVDCAIYARSRDASGVVNIEREAKLAPEVSFKLQIPFIYHDHKSGERQLWEPFIVPHGVGEEESRAHAPAPKQHEDGTTEPKRKGGDSIAYKLRHMGKGPFTMAELKERLDQSESTIINQLEKGIQNGSIRQVGERYAAV